LVITGVTIAITIPSIRHQTNLNIEIMKTTEPNNNNIKNNKMYRLTFLFAVLISLTATASINKDCEILNSSLNSELHKLEKTIFVNAEDSASEIADVNDVEVIEIEEEVVINFDTKTYLPEDFNALKGLYNLDWTLIEVIELEEEVELGFDTSKYLPKSFNALKGKHDLDWSTIELIEIEEDIDLGFDTQKYLPQGFNAHQGEHI